MELNPNIRIAQIQNTVDIGILAQRPGNTVDIGILAQRPGNTVDIGILAQRRHRVNNPVHLVGTVATGIPMNSRPTNPFVRLSLAELVPFWLAKPEKKGGLELSVNGIDKCAMIIVYGDNISKHDSYLFDGQVIASAFFKGNEDINELDCTLRTGNAIDGTVMLQILYKHCGGNYCVKLPVGVSLKHIAKYGINFTNGNRLIFIQTFVGFVYCADFYKISATGYIEFISI